MRNVRIACAAVLALSGSLLADSVISSTGSFSAVPTGWAAQTAPWTNSPPPSTAGTTFWNDPSADAGTGGSHAMNVGYLLTDSGGFAGTSSVLGSDSLAEDLTASGGGDPTDFNFVSSSVAHDVAVLFAESDLDTGNAAHGTTFGFYSGSTFTPLYNPTDTNFPSSFTSFNPTTMGGSYGFYATVCYQVGQCETYTSGNGNSGNVAGAGAWNRFALFQLTSGNFVIAFEDTIGYAGEGQGDFNDVVVELSATGSVPEPGTIAITGLGVLALLGAKRNALKRHLFVRAL